MSKSSPLSFMSTRSNSSSDKLQLIRLLLAEDGTWTKFKFEFFDIGGLIWRSALRGYDLLFLYSIGLVWMNHPIVASGYLSIYSRGETSFSSSDLVALSTRLDFSVAS